MMLRAARRFGAVAVLATGVVHLQQCIVQNVWFYPAIARSPFCELDWLRVVGIGLLAPLKRLRLD